MLGESSELTVKSLTNRPSYTVGHAPQVADCGQDGVHFPVAITPKAEKGGEQVINHVDSTGEGVYRSVRTKLGERVS